MTTNNSASGESLQALVQAGVITGGVNIHGTRAPVPHNLPPTTRHFVGRRDDLDRLTRLAEAEAGSRICVVDGAPGIGKTVFALHWGSMTRDSFPDGQVYVDLRGFDPRRSAVEPGVAMRMILGALHVPGPSIPSELDDQLAFFRSVVDDQKLLLIIDNVRDSDQVRSLLPGSSKSFTVVTARHRLDGLVLHHGAERLTLDQFTDQESIDLLKKHIGGLRVRAERDAAERVVAVCAGHPLALSMVAARAAADIVNPLQRIVDELEDKNAALDALQLADAADFRAVFALSYECLPTPLATAFRDLALHSGTGIDVRAAAAITSTDVRGAHRIAGELARRNLTEQAGAGRYTFHDLTHAYGLEKAHLNDSPEHRLSVLRAWLNHQLHAADRADRLINDHRRPVILEPCARPDLLPTLRDRADALTWFSVEYDNVIAAITTAIEEHLHHYIWQLAWVMSNFAYLSARWQDWIDTHVKAVEAAQYVSNLPIETRLRQSLARAHCESGAYQQSIDGYRAALLILEELDDSAGRANALNGLSGAELRSGASAKAIETGLQALQLYLSVADEAGTASTYSLLGRACSGVGRHEDARRYHQLASALYETSGNLYGRAHVADCRAELELIAANPESAAQHLRKAIELHYIVGNRHYVIGSCRKLREILVSLGRPEQEITALSKAITFLENYRDASVVEVLGMVEGGSGYR